MDDIQQMLQRQAEWQKARKSLSWPEKIRMVEAIRESILELRRSGPQRPETPAGPPRPRLVDPS